MGIIEIGKMSKFLARKWRNRGKILQKIRDVLRCPCFFFNECVNRVDLLERVVGAHGGRLEAACADAVKAPVAVPGGAGRGSDVSGCNWRVEIKVVLIRSTRY